MEPTLHPNGRKKERSKRKWEKRRLRRKLDRSASRDRYSPGREG